jgi:hypothetical protein
MFISSKIFKSFIKVTIIYYEKVNRSKWTRNIWYKNWDIKVLWPPFKFLIAHLLFSRDHLLCYSDILLLYVLLLYCLLYSLNTSKVVSEINLYSLKMLNCNALSFDKFYKHKYKLKHKMFSIDKSNTFWWYQTTNHWIAFKFLKK